MSQSDVWVETIESGLARQDKNDWYCLFIYHISSKNRFLSFKKHTYSNFGNQWPYVLSDNFCVGFCGRVAYQQMEDFDWC